MRYLNAAGLIAFVTAGVMLSGCSLDDQKITSTVNVTLNNLVISEKDPSQVDVQPDVTYTVNYDQTAGTAQVVAAGLTIGNAKTGISTDIMPYSQLVNTAGYVNIFSGSGKTTDAAATPVLDFSGVETTLFYYYPTAVPGVVGVTAIDRRLLLTYNVGDDYTVRTFPSDIYFGGTTSTRYSMMGQSKTFESKDPIFRVVFSANLKKATVVIYNARFAEEMPALEAVVLQDLDVTYDATGYKISGSDVVAGQPEAGGLTPYESKPFKSFLLYTKGKYLVQAQCDYTVHDTRMNIDFYGSFTGQYAETGDTASATGK